ncbi:Hypothetical predicted protein [Pelobates cultripes]|uniref:Schizont-infected cell agglutination extracellular alpha domain-containing protein n=1 Tax=Pelobates cultripes TaxID=61616 RepID=A0AAD1RCU4_PELCU|nr:Hypothetical predicted protein [Pelobates cultripes]
MPHSPASDGPAESELIENKSLHTMLQDLKASLRADFSQMATELCRNIHDEGGRTSNLKTKTEELCSAHNEVVDKLQRQEEEQAAMQQKMADMEDRSQRNNIRFCGIADTITAEAHLDNTA